MKIHRTLANNEECPWDTKSTEEQRGKRSISNTVSVHTYRDNNVPMVAFCPLNYENADIKKYCETTQTDLFHDVWLITPVDDSETETGETYKNVFCAACNGRPLTNVSFWKLLPSCIETKTGTTFCLKDENRNYGSIFTNLFPRKIGYWKYRSGNTPVEDLICFLHSTKDVFLRPGNPSSCGCKCTKMEESPSFMPNNTNNTRSENSSTESSDFIPKPEPLSLDCLQSSIDVNLNDKNLPSPRFSRCNDGLRRQDKILYDILCTENKCKHYLVDSTKFKYYPKSMTSNMKKIENFEAEVNDSIKHTWVAVIYTILLFILRTAVVGLIIHELIFLWLPAKSTLDKNLGSLGFTLLIQNLCALYDSQKKILSCRIVASIWHYSMLSSFTWVLILSYDCWLSLRQLFQLYDLIGEYDQMQFLIYFAVSQVGKSMHSIFK